MNTTIILLAFIAVVISVAWGTKFKTNVGVVALVFAFLLGTFGMGMSPAEIYAFWPARTTVQLIVVTAFFGFAVESGTIQYIAKVVLYWVRNVPWLIPVVYLGLNFALSAIGVSPPAVNMFLFPIFMTLCYATQTSELFLTVGANAGGMSGTLSSLGMVGIMLAGMISSSGLEIDIQGTVMHVFLNATKAFFILYAIYYVVLRLYRIQLPKELIQRPEPPTKQQKMNLAIIFICILFLFVPSIFQAFCPNPITAALSKLDISLVYAGGIMACVLFRIGSEKDVFKKSIPWSVIILLGGMTCLMGVMRQAGLSELISGAVSNGVSDTLIPVLIVLLSGVLSLFSDGTSVVMPLMVPIAISISVATGISAPLLISCVCVPAIGMGMSPFSTGGGVFLSFVREERFQKMMFQSLIAVLCNLGLLCVMALIGIIS